MYSTQGVARSVIGGHASTIESISASRANMQRQLTPRSTYQQVQAGAMAQLNAPAGTAAATPYVSNASSSSAPYEQLIEQAAREYNLNPNLIRAVMETESSFRPDLVSEAGAQGLMQLMPDTAKQLGVTDRTDPAQNIRGGSQYLSQMLERFSGDYRLALAAYSRGPGYVESLGIAPNTQDLSQYAKLSEGAQGYVSKVLRLV